MKFSIKSAGQYSNVLSEMIVKIGFVSCNAEEEGLVKKTEIAQKSKIITGKSELKFEDEEKEIKPIRRVAQINPMTRIQILKDLVDEKNKIDYAINENKKNLTVVSPFTGKEINVDLATKENSLYRFSLMKNGYEEMLNVNSEEIESTKRMDLYIDNQKMSFEYPVITKLESNVDSGKVNKDYSDLYEKTQQSSNLIDEALSSTLFDFDCKFPLYKNIEKIISMYKA